VGLFITAELDTARKDPHRNHPSLRVRYQGQAFTFLGAGLDAVANKITFVQEGGDTIVQVDVNGDAPADFSVQLKGLHALTATDFV
jgi:hypothetical protein